MISKKMEKLSVLADSVVFKHILTLDGYREKLLSQYYEMTQNIPWDRIAHEALVKNTEGIAKQTTIDLRDNLG